MRSFLRFPRRTPPESCVHCALVLPSNRAAYHANGHVPPKGGTIMITQDLYRGAYVSGDGWSATGMPTRRDIEKCVDAWMYADAVARLLN